MFSRSASSVTCSNKGEEGGQERDGRGAQPGEQAALAPHCSPSLQQLQLWKRERLDAGRYSCAVLSVALALLPSAAVK